MIRVDVKTVKEKFLQIDGNKIRYLESGNSKKTLVLIHGLGASAERWDQVIPLFSKDYRVIVPDLIGFGYSDKPLVDYTTEFFTGFLKKFFTSLDIRQANLIGSSLGGQISAEYAAFYPNDVKRMILVSPSGNMGKSTPALDAYIMAALYPNEQSAKNAFEIMDGSGRDVRQEIINGFVSRMRLPNAKVAFISTLLGIKHLESFREKLQRVSSPTMIVWGSDDPVIPINHAEYFVSAIQDCRFFRMDGCGHTPYVQKPYVFASKVLEFLKSH